MIHEIHPKKYSPAFINKTASDTDYALAYEKNSVFAYIENGQVFLPRFSDLKELPGISDSKASETLEESDAISSINTIKPANSIKQEYHEILKTAYYLFAISDENYFLADFNINEFPIMENSEQLVKQAKALRKNERFFFSMNINHLRDLLFIESADNLEAISSDPNSMTPLLFAAATGSHMAWWKRSRRYCGCCGTETEPSKTERAMVCPACKNIEYPKISPAIIVAIIKRGKTKDKDKLLLVRNNYGSYRKLALVAGFVEIGESFEQAIHREVLEETGLKVKNLRYYKNQPWGLSYAQMIGFTAELDGDDTIKLQENELSEGGWYLRSEAPNNPSCLSVGNEMIHMFRIGEL